jgi:hypothetical protein
MKSITLASLTLVVLLFVGCEDSCKTTTSFIQFRPVYANSEALKDSVALEPGRVLKQPGKIYLKDQYLFINEPGEGIHIIDNADAENPVTLYFLNIPGNFDLAAQGNYLYADSFVDLITFDISDVNNIKEVHRAEGVFRNFYNHMGLWSDGITLVGYEEVVVEERYDGNCEPLTVNNCWNCVGMPELAAFDTQMRNLSGSASNSQGGGAGVGGSMARFTLSANHLYTLDMEVLRSFDINDLTTPSLVSEKQIGWGMETIFPYEDHLYLGANNGMYIYNISDPGNPSFVSVYEHVTACDPVVVQGDIAFVTLRSGNNCFNQIDVLEVLDISDKGNPALLETFPMHNPHGLGIDGNCLFICEGDQGLKFFDASDVYSIDQHQLAHFDYFHAYDVIPFNNLLMVIGEDGLYQYSYNCDPGELTLLSTIQVIRQ